MEAGAEPTALVVIAGSVAVFKLVTLVAKSKARRETLHDLGHITYNKKDYLTTKSWKSENISPGYDMYRYCYDLRRARYAPALEAVRLAVEVPRSDDTPTLESLKCFINEHLCTVAYVHATAGSTAPTTPVQNACYAIVRRCGVQEGAVSGNAVVQIILAGVSAALALGVGFIQLRRDRLLIDGTSPAPNRLRAATRAAIAGSALLCFGTTKLGDELVGRACVARLSPASESEFEDDRRKKSTGWRDDGAVGLVLSVSVAGFGAWLIARAAKLLKGITVAEEVVQ